MLEFFALNNLNLICVYQVEGGIKLMKVLWRYGHKVNASDSIALRLSFEALVCLGLCLRNDMVGVQLLEHGSEQDCLKFLFKHSKEIFQRLKA